MKNYESTERERYDYSVPLPDGVECRYDNARVHMKGPKGEISKVLLSKMVGISVADGQVRLVTPRATKNNKKMVHTYRAHIKNMIVGVTEGHIYKVAIASSHFPMNVTVSGTTVTVKNFVGEKKPRTLTAPDDVKITIDGNIITITSSNKEHAGNFAGNLEKLTLRSKFDNRIFQDGLYITEKDSKKV